MNIPTVEIQECRLCRSSDLGLILDYGDMPMAGGFVPLEDPRRMLTAPLRLGICHSCGLMQVLDSVDPGELFAEYSYRSSSAPALQGHFADLARHIDEIRKYTWPTGPIDRFRCVDIGCNDGVLIGHLRERGIEVFGIDPSDVAARAAKEDGWVLYNDYATPALARSIVQEQGRMHVVTACNVLAHTDDIHAMVEAAKLLLRDDGVLIVEVQYQVDLLAKVQFDTVYHEHRSYFTLANLTRLFAEHGLTIWQADHISTHSGSIRVHAGIKKTLLSWSAESWAATEQRYRPYNFGVNAEQARNRIRRIFASFAREIPIAAYGAAGRSTILLNWCGITEVDLRYIVDRSPLRIGCVVPGTRLPIVGMEKFQADDWDRPAITLITAWNYAESIIKQHPEYKGLWMTPLPEVRIV